MYSPHPTSAVRSESSPLRQVVHLFITIWLIVSLPLSALASPIPRIFVVPPSSDGNDQSEQIGKRLESSLREYLKKSKRLKLEDGKAQLRESKDGRLMEAESTKVSSIDLFREGKNQEAYQGFVNALKGFQKSVASIRDMKSVYQTLYYAAATAMALEYDDDAKDYLQQLSAIAPEGNFEVQVSKDVSKKYDRERKRLLKKKRGALQIETTPPGAQVWVNGEERCISPCEVKELPRGLHYVWVNKDGVGKAGGVNKVKAGWSSPLKFNLIPAKTGELSSPVPPELQAKITGQLSEAKIDRQLKEYLDVIAEEQEVSYASLIYILSQNREVEAFAFVYDYNEKRAVATASHKFKANFSATRITAMKLVKEIESLVKSFPEDQNIDGIYPPLAAAIETSKSSAVAVAVVPPVAPSVVPPVKVTPPAVQPPIPDPKEEDPKSEETKTAAITKTLPPPKVEDFKAPPPSQTMLLPPPTVPENKEDDRKGILASPWFWTGIGVAVVAGATTGAYLLLDSSTDQQSYQSRVEW